MSRVLLGVCASLALGFGVQTWRVHSLQADVVTLEGKLKSETDRADKSEELRATEQSQDKASYAAQADACEVRVAAARDAGRIISEVTKVATDTNGAAAGSYIIGADSLRGIIGQTAGTEAAGMSDGAIPAGEGRAEVAR